MPFPARLGSWRAFVWKLSLGPHCFPMKKKRIRIGRMLFGAIKLENWKPSFSRVCVQICFHVYVEMCSRTSRFPQRFSDAVTLLRSSFVCFSLFYVLCFSQVYVRFVKYGCVLNFLRENSVLIGRVICLMKIGKWKLGKFVEIIVMKKCGLGHRS